jgi:hypothetical protein
MRLYNLWFTFLACPYFTLNLAMQVFVGEIVEEACQAREKAKEEGAPLQPKHIREAVRKLKNSDKLPNSKYKKVFPNR